MIHKEIVNYEKDYFMDVYFVGNRNHLHRQYEQNDLCMVQRQR